MYPEDPPVVTKSRIYEMIRHLEAELADGFVLSPHRNQEILQLAYLALHKQEGVE